MTNPYIRAAKQFPEIKEKAIIALELRRQEEPVKEDKASASAQGE